MKDEVERLFGHALSDDDCQTLSTLAGVLRAGGAGATCVRDVAANVQMGAANKGLAFQPYQGQILACNFSTGFQLPEMRKVRPVIVVSPQPRFRSGLATVVAISSQAPQNPQPYHVKLPDALVPGNREAWAKCDVIYQVGLHRLDRFKSGFRTYVAPIADLAVLKSVQEGVLHGLGLHQLTVHL